MTAGCTEAQQQLARWEERLARLKRLHTLLRDEPEGTSGDGGVVSEQGEPPPSEKRAAGPPRPAAPDLSTTTMDSVRLRLEVAHDS